MDIILIPGFWLDAGYVDLPTGHWPQFTKPGELGQAILASAGPA